MDISPGIYKLDNSIEELPLKRTNREKDILFELEKTDLLAMDGRKVARFLNMEDVSRRFTPLINSARSAAPASDK